MARIYSFLFFSGTVLDGVPTTVPMSTFDGVKVVRTTRVVYAGDLLAVNYAISSTGGQNFLYVSAVPGPFNDVRNGRDVWDGANDMVLSCTGADMDFRISGYLLST